ncbi:MAG: transcription termination/antitermination factor NusG [Candidatus Dadabacteria bacterium]|nr:MAG: transcription termination/antitermination factor NusG [Candidatus Dadabacteria bacterium]
MGIEVTGSEQAAESAEQPFRWYALQVFSGHENKVRELIEERARAEGYDDRIVEVLLPVENVVEVVRGKKRQSKRKFFPGYLLVRMQLDDDTWGFIKKIGRVTGFVGDASRPVAIPDEDVERIVSRIEKGKEEPQLRIRFEPGENVRVIEGPFANFTGVIQEVNDEKGKIQVMVSIFGRNTPVELDFTEVEKV